MFRTAGADVIHAHVLEGACAHGRLDARTAAHVARAALDQVVRPCAAALLS